MVIYTIEHIQILEVIETAREEIARRKKEHMEKSSMQEKSNK